MHQRRITGARTVRAMALLSVAALGLTGTGGLAQQAAEVADGGDGDMIVVTARTFAEDLQRVPTTVSVITAQDIERQGLDDLSRIARATPGFAFENFTGALAQPTIRGQTNLRVTSPVTNVATYLDGVYMQRAFLIDQSLLALDRIEIIKGPQSALYGRNAFAGVINLVSRRPDLEEFRARARAGIGTDQFYELQGTVNVPIIPGKLAVLGHIAWQDFDGTIRNSHPLANDPGAITRGKLGGFENEAYQATILVTPSEVLTIQASYFHTQRLLEHVPNYSFGTASALTDPYNYNNCSVVAGQARLFCGQLSTDPNTVTGAQSSPILPVGPDPRQPGFLIDPRAFGLRGPTDVVSARVDFSPQEPFTLTYLFGYTFGNIDARGSTARDPLRPLVIGPTNFGVLFDSSGTGSVFEGWSHEMRATFESEKLLAFFGANYSTTSDIESNASETFPLGTTATPGQENILFPIGPGLPFPFAVFQRRTFLERNEDIISVYGFAEVRPSERFRFTLEGRYTIEDRETIDFLTREPTNPTIQALNPPRDKVTESFFAPRFSAAYDLSPNNLLFASVAKGVKAGGSNGFVPFIPQRQYARETNWTYEIGSKNRFPEIGLTLNGAIYYTNWQDLQTTEARRLADGTVPTTFAVLSTVTGNVGSVNVWGAELEGNWRIVEGLTFEFGGSYNRSRYKDGEVSQRFQLSGNCDGTVCPLGPVPIGGNQVERIPEFDGFVALGYEGEFAPERTFFVRADATYQTKQYADEVNLAWVSDRFLVNAQAGVTIGRFNIQGNVQNLFDKNYVSNALFLIGTGGARSSSYVPIMGPRRTARISVGVDF